MRGRGGGGGAHGRRGRPMMTTGGAPRHPRGGSGGGRHQHDDGGYSSSSSSFVDGRQHQYQQGRPRDHGNFNKRGRDQNTFRQGGDPDEYGGEVVDDLLVAAQYASMSLSGGKRDEVDNGAGSTTTAGPEEALIQPLDTVADENEIDTDEVGDLDHDEGVDGRSRRTSSQAVGDAAADGDTAAAASDGEAEDMAAKSASNPTDTDQDRGAADDESSGDDGSVKDDGDDDESTVDLEAELARMTEAGLDDDEDEGHNDRSRTAGPHRTAHEVLEEEEVNEVDPRTLAADPLKSSQSSSASPDRHSDDPSLGRLVPIHFEGNDWRKHFQRCGAVQRKVVGETSAASNSATTATTTTTLIVQADPSHLLEEGNVLWILIEPLDVSDDGHDVAKESDVTRRYMAMVGIVTEVFGPVRQPCYKVRVLIPVVRDASAAAAKASASVERPSVVDNSTTNETSVEPDNDLAAPTVAPNENAVQASSAPSWKVSSRVLESWSDRQVEVYYRVGMVTTLDTHQVWRQSGRGCDASNLWDEEVMDANAMEYSDDEQEQLAKQRHKHSRKDPPQPHPNSRPRDGGDSHVNVTGDARASHPAFHGGTRSDRATVDRTPVYPKPTGGVYHHFPSSDGASPHFSPAYTTNPAAAGVPYQSHQSVAGPQGFHSNASSQPPIGPNRYPAPQHAFPPVGSIPVSATTGFGPAQFYNNSGGGASIPHSSSYPASYYYPMMAGSPSLSMPPPPPPPPAAAPTEESDTIYYDYS